MSTQLLQAIDQVSREKGIDAEIIISAVEEAIIAAAKKIFKTDETFGARFNRSTGDLEVWAVKEVAEEVTNPRRQIPMSEASLYYDGVEIGDTIEFQKDTSKLGRIAAHAAKQVILQKVRDAEKEKIFGEFSERLGEVVTAVVRRFERGNVIVDLGNNVEGIMHRDEQSKNERYNQNDRTKVVIVGADRSTKEPQVKCSRADARLLIKLFEMEVPEVYDGTVVIKNASREAGDRSKIAVYSTDSDVDPIGACVGMGGSRVRSIIRELKGERLDIIRYSDDIATFASNSLSPARINRVVLSDPFNKRLEVIVDDDQLSLAIGKKGQNVRLGSKLVGWTIEVKTEEQKREEAAAEMSRLEAMGEEELEDEAVAANAVAAEEERVPADIDDERVPDDFEDEDYDVADEDDDATDDVEEDGEGEEESGDEGVSLEYLDGLSEKHRQILEAYSIYYIEDILYTDSDVLHQIPELEDGDVDHIISLANAYAQEFGDDEEEESEEA
jgi:N utilization substance protein A